MSNKTYLIFKFVRPIIALLIVTGAFLFMFVLVYRAVPKDNMSLVALVVGYVLGLLSGVSQYYFGTSKDKSDAEQKLMTPGTTTTSITSEKKETI